MSMLTFEELDGNKISLRPKDIKFVTTYDAQNPGLNKILENGTCSLVCEGPGGEMYAFSIHGEFDAITDLIVEGERE